MSVSVDGLAEAIAKELAAYSQEVTDGIKAEVRTVAKECAKDIKKNSPELTGDYKKGWSTKVAYEGREDIRVTVRNRTDYQLTHLLEHGFAHVHGGRVAAQPHIGPAEKRAEEKLLKRVKVVVKGDT